MKIKQIEERIGEFADQLNKHRVANAELNRQLLAELAVGQLFNSIMWPGYLAAMRGRVMNPILSEALKDNILCETGVSDPTSHVTLCQRFVESMGLDPYKEMNKGMPRSARPAFTLVTRVLTMSEAQIVGWSLATEMLTPVRFKILLPAYQMLEGVDTTYLHEHVSVDSDEHAPRIREAAEALLIEDSTLIAEMLVGVEIAGQRALAIFDGIMPPPEPGFRAGMWSY